MWHGTAASAVPRSRRRAAGEQKAVGNQEFSPENSAKRKGVRKDANGLSEMKRLQNLETLKRETCFS